MSAIPYQQPYTDPYMRWKTGCQRIRQEIEEEKIAFEMTKSFCYCQRVASGVSAVACGAMGLFVYLMLELTDELALNGVNIGLAVSGVMCGAGCGILTYLTGHCLPTSDEGRFRYRLVEPRFAAQQKIRLKELANPAECCQDLNDLCDAGIITPDIKAGISGFSERFMSCQRKIKKVEGYDKKVLAETKRLLSESASLKNEEANIFREWKEYRDSIIDQIPNPLEYAVESV